MSDIAGARTDILRIAAELDAEGDARGELLRQVVQRKMFRRRPVRKMPAHSVRVSPRIRERIFRLAEETDLHTSEIAAQVGVNPGRVSEVLNGA